MKTSINTFCSQEMKKINGIMKFPVLHVSFVLSCVLLVVWCKCREPINLYDDFKCKPIWKSGDNQHKRCPKAFDCTHIRQNNKCFFNGQYYKVGQNINETTNNLPSCITECTCNRNYEWDCRVYTCPWDPPPDGCYNTYDLRGCCSTGFHCPNQNTLRCRANDILFSYGQTFESPSVNCAVCECQPGYTGKPNDPHCKKRICDAELYLNAEIQAFCAPSYQWKGDCCPGDYLCPSKEDEWDDDDRSIAVSEDSDVDGWWCDSSSSNDNLAYACRYGDNYYRIGAEFKRKEEFDEDHDLYTRCECVIPPYFTCIRDRVPPDDD
ncbi:uncharacterized protein [Atheta coriaria]|uniref:uncharacterized protein n=1 Tax=Dalotia coriaria TaxID=877792 RepID=UPI0031F47755